MDANAKARNKYKELRDCKSFWSECDQKESELELGVKNAIYIAIKGATSSPSKLFHFGQIPDILKQGLKKQVALNADIQPVTKAFDNLELYFVLLVEQPWKPEFKKLKMYGGFYRTKIKSVLPEPECIFKLAGYDIDKSKNLLVLKKPVQRDNLLTLAFDCRMAASLCLNIEAHYKKLRSLDKTLGDAVSDILQDPSFSALSAKARMFPMKSGGVVITPSPSVHVKREPTPHVNGITEVSTVPPSSISHQQVQLQNSSKLPSSSMSLNTSGHNRALFSSCTPEYRPGAPVAEVVPGGRIPSAGPPVTVDDHLVCIGPPQAEILPILPELTTEEHMRESLRLMEGQRSSKHMDDTSSEPNSRHANTFDDLAWNHQSNLIVPIGSDKYSAYTFPPAGYINLKNHVPVSALDNPSIDEGIEGDISTLSKSSARYHLTADAQSYLPSKIPPTILQQQPFSVDQGYRTGPGTMQVPPSPKNPLSSALAPRKIYLPPEVDTPSASDLGLQLRSRQPSVPSVQTQTSAVNVAPPIPPRELKPTSSTVPLRRLGEDMVDGPFSETTTAKGGARTNLNGALRHHSHGLSMAGVSMNGQTSVNHMGGGRGKSEPQHSPQGSDLEPNLRRSRISSTGRSGSLKSAEPRSPLALEMSQARVARSMEFTSATWQCSSCTTINAASARACIVCSCSRRGLDMSTVSGGEFLSCPKCTFANAPGRTRCEVCDGSLVDDNGHSYMM